MKIESNDAVVIELSMDELKSLCIDLALALKYKVSLIHMDNQFDWVEDEMDRIITIKHICDVIGDSTPYKNLFNDIDRMFMNNMISNMYIGEE